MACLSSAHAQEAAAPALEEVVVTATKRSQSLQDVPESIQALSSADLEQQHVGGINDFVKLLPSVSYQTLGPGFARIYMRGVSSGGDGNRSGSLPSVGIYLDEQPVTTIQGPIDVHIYDIARVESLSGPQGTLFGASSEAGTLRIITNKPDPRAFQAAYDVQGKSFLGGGPGDTVEGFVNLPIAERAAVRLVGWQEHDGGYIDNVPGRTTFPFSGFTNDNSAVAANRYNTVDTRGARAALRLDLNDSWTVTPAIMAQSTNHRGIFAYDPRIGDLAVTHSSPENGRDRWNMAALTVEGRISDFELVYAGGFLRRNVETNSDYTDYSLAYEIAYQRMSSYFSDNAGSPINPTQRLYEKDGFKMFSHELRVTTPKDKPLRATAGLFMQRQEHDIHNQYLINGLADASSVTGWPGSFWLAELLRVNRDYAAFTEVSYDLTPALTATAGARHFQSRNSLAGFLGFRSFEARCANFPNGGVPGYNGAPCNNFFSVISESGSTPKFNLSYRFDPNRMIYATLSKGFRPGGNNRVLGVPPFKADYLTNYEVGWKTSWLGNTLRLNGALFVESWKDIQYSFTGPNGITETRNAGRARIDGLEIASDWAASSSWTLSSAVTLMNPRLTQPYCAFLTPSGDSQTSDCLNYTAGPPGVPAPFGAPAGQQLPTTPKFKGDLTARYQFSLRSFDAHIQGSVVYQSSVWPELRTTEREILGRQSPYALFDFSAGLARGNYSAELFVNNAFDRRAEIFRYAECNVDLCGPIAVYHGVYAPRSIGVKVEQRF